MHVARPAALVPGSSPGSPPGSRCGADAARTGRDHLAAALDHYRGRIAVLSSFGADAAVLLALVAEIDRHTPVLFLQTGRHFAQTLAYRESLAAFLGLSDVRDVTPAGLSRSGEVADDGAGNLWFFDPDACCALRKTRPLEAALAGFDAWVTGRKRHQAATRQALPFVETDGPRCKINPLADWTAGRIAAEFARRGLPKHPLVAQGYASIGCEPCTRPVTDGEDSRAGRWSHSVKVECGIHHSTNRLPLPRRQVGPGAE
jgi:phosphoadenosine phosphosulfate reductase